MVSLPHIWDNKENVHEGQIRILLFQSARAEDAQDRARTALRVFLKKEETRLLKAHGMIDDLSNLEREICCKVKLLVLRLLLCLVCMESHLPVPSNAGSTHIRHLQRR